MPWTIPKTDWDTNPTNPVADDFNRIEGNIDFLNTDIETKKGLIVDALSSVGIATLIADTHVQIANKILSAKKTGVSITPGTVNQEIPKGIYDTGGGLVVGDADLVGANIKPGVSIFGVAGAIPSKSAATITPGTTNQVISAGQYLTGDQTITGDADLISTNIKAGANIFGVAGNSNVVDTSAGDATAAQILSGKKAYVDGALVTGTAVNKGAATITPGTVNQTIAANTLCTGVQTILGSANLAAGNIKDGVNIFGVIGTVKPMFKGFNKTSDLNTSYAAWGIAYGAGLYVVAGEGGKIWTSPDLVTWTSRSSGTSNTLTCVCYGNGVFVASGSGYTCYSTNGISWTSVSLSYSFRKLRYINNRFVGVKSGSSALTAIGTSTNGISWTFGTVTPGASYTQLEDVAYVNGVYIAVGAYGTKGVVLSSTDLATWNVVTITLAYGLNGIVWDGSKFVSVSDTEDYCMTSTNGTSWTINTGAYLPGTVYSLNYFNGLFVAVGVNYIQVSFDGLEWYSMYSNLGASIKAFESCYANGNIIICGDEGMLSYGQY